MKLRNKKTGEIGYLQNDTLIKRLRVVNTNNDTVGEYNSLAELNSEWEDYEEPKESYYIDCDGEIYEPVRLSCTDLDNMTSIGNYFETREEAEKAVEKLKAWKRLKDKFNFGFNGIIKDERNGKVVGARLTYTVKQITFQESYQVERDLYVLFGGEE